MRILLLCAMFACCSAFSPSIHRTCLPVHRLPLVKPKLSKRPQLSMNIFTRFFRVIASNINSVLKFMEDPEKVLDQAVIDMKNDLTRIRQSYAEVLATQKRMQKQKEEAETNAQEWHRRAQLALQKGDEDLAREALTRKQAFVHTAEVILKQLSTQSAALEKLFSSMTSLENKISESSRNKDLMVARARTAKTAVKVSDMLNGINYGESSVAAFERMKEKVEALEIQAEMADELTVTNTNGGSSKLESKFKTWEVNASVEEELAKLKNEVSIPGRKKSLFANLPIIDVEIDDGKAESKKILPSIKNNEQFNH